MSTEQKLSAHLGFNIVAYGHKKEESVNSRRNPVLEIVQGDSSDDGAYFPARSIEFHNADQITYLRDFCNRLLVEDKPIESGGNKA
jgi:hypothetical protein